MSKIFSLDSSVMEQEIIEIKIFNKSLLSKENILDMI